MRNKDWNDCENRHFEKFAKQDEGLAYTIVMEMYHARKAQEAHDEEKRSIVAAIDQIADGICTLERILKINIHKMSEKHSAAQYEMFKRLRGTE